jgi:antitoxin (DNA-binding transcriptional repressor) of toxin-antitoxin stability system
MIRVGVRELRNKLSRYLRLVREGQTVLVTDRDRVVAEIRQREAAGGTDSLRRYLEVGGMSGTIRPAAHTRSRIRTLLSARGAAHRSAEWKAAYEESRADR